jgi:hypothetical protein
MPTDAASGAGEAGNGTWLTFVAADAADRSFAIRRRVQAEQLGVRDAYPP